LNLVRFQKIFTQVCSALEHAHKQGVIHRDLKPGNIMLMDEELDFVKVVDFGLARLVEEDRKITQTGQVWGSPPYMSPEQWTGGHCDQRSDIYSLGAVMYELITGKDPFFGSEIHQFSHKHVFNKPPSFIESKPDILVPPALEAVVFKALEKAPDDRFQNATELREELAKACAAPMTQTASIKRDMSRLRATASETVLPDTVASKKQLADERPDGKRARWMLNILVPCALACLLIVCSVVLTVWWVNGQSEQHSKSLLQTEVRKDVAPNAVQIPIEQRALKSSIVPMAVPREAGNKSTHQRTINNLVKSTLTSPTPAMKRKLAKPVMAKIKKSKPAVAVATVKTGRVKEKTVKSQGSEVGQWDDLKKKLSPELGN
jgi:serine/threonine protein kinase